MIQRLFIKSFLACADCRKVNSLAGAFAVRAVVALYARLAMTLGASLGLIGFVSVRHHGQLVPLAAAVKTAIGIPGNCFASLNATLWAGAFFFAVVTITANAVFSRLSPDVKSVLHGLHIHAAFDYKARKGFFVIVITRDLGAG